jgi:transcriptional regulator with XRE-family HTH domain
MARIKTRRGARLAQARRKAGLTQQALADKIGTPRARSPASR